MTPITDTDLDRLEELHAKATVAPWIVLGDASGVWNDDIDEEVFNVADDTLKDRFQSLLRIDLDMLCAARNALPALVAEVRGLRQELADLRAQHAADVEAAYREGWADADSDGAPYTQDTDWRASYAKQRLDGAGEGK